MLTYTMITDNEYKKKTRKEKADKVFLLWLRCGYQSKSVFMSNFVVEKKNL